MHCAVRHSIPVITQSTGIIEFLCLSFVTISLLRSETVYGFIVSSFSDTFTCLLASREADLDKVYILSYNTCSVCFKVQRFSKACLRLKTVSRFIWFMTENSKERSTMNCYPKCLRIILCAEYMFYVVLYKCVVQDTDTLLMWTWLCNSDQHFNSCTRPAEPLNHSPLQKYSNKTIAIQPKTKPQFF